MVHNCIIRKIFESSVLINLFGDINVAHIFYKIESNLLQGNKKRQIIWDRGSTHQRPLVLLFQASKL
jgi:hypothetical protein